MNKSFKKMLSVFIAFVVVLTTLAIAPFTASAANGPVDVEKDYISIWADPQNVLTQNNINISSANTLATLGGIKPYKRSHSSGTGVTSGDANYYWFFPSSADLDALTLWFEEGKTVTINGTEVFSGQATGIFSELNAGGISKTYTVRLNNTNYNVTAIKSGDVGAVYIDTNSGSLKQITDSSDHSFSEGGSIMIVQPDGKVDYNGIMEKMSGRGNGTWSSTGKKNPYNVKLAKSTSLLGMGSAKKWCLLANDVDKTLVKNQLTYDFADYIGIKYQPHCKPVDLYVNQQYLGSYQLAEKVEIKSNRINISDAYENLEIANGTTDTLTGAIIPADLTGTAVETVGKTTGGTLNNKDFTGHTVGAYKYSKLTSPTDYSGGYLYELEISNRWVNENAGFCAYNRQGWVIKSADYASEDMVKYSYNLLYALGAAVYNNGTVPSTSTTTNCSSLSAVTERSYGARSITNPAPTLEYQGKRWSDILDAESAVKYYWTQEFFKNMDSSTSSTYFYKDSDAVDSKLYAGPMWDMDNSLGTINGSSASRWGSSYSSPEGWYTKNARIYRWRCEDSTMDYSTDKKSPLNFYAALATNCTDFWTMAEKYYYKYITPAVDILLGNAVDSTGKLNSIAYYVNTINKSAQMDAIRHDTTYNASNYINSLTTWVDSRQTWIDNNITKIDLSGASIGAINNQFYTGDEVKPSLDVKLFVSGTGTVTLEEGLDYSLSYTNNINTGKATVTVNGIGKYKGQVSSTFNIIAADIRNWSLSIDNAAYKDMEIAATLTNTDGKEINSSVSYQWYKDGVAINGATQQTYMVAESDGGSVITCVATGDGANISGSVTSNGCNVFSGTRPEGYDRTIASWNYDYTNASEALVSAAELGTGYYYTATDGENQATSNLYASVNAVDDAKIKWSGTADLYSNDTITDQVPVMGTSKTDGLAWGTYPYFETVVSTAGYENIKFSAKLGGTKKAPRDWKLQYSLDGSTYTDVTGATYSITANKTLENAFNEVILPEACNNQPAVYIRMVVDNDIAINGINTIVNQTSGDAAVNNIKVTGASLAVVTELYEPSFATSNKLTTLFDDNDVIITDNNGGADIYYSVNGGEATLYTGAFNPFNSKTAKVGDKAVITAYASFNDITSNEATYTVTFGGVDINKFSYETYSTDVTSGAVQSTGGVYDQSGKMTAYTDGVSQYVPQWNDDKGAFLIAPDDGAKWSADSGFTFKISTAGYDNVNFSAMVYTTGQGPKSVSLQYSLDGKTYKNVETNVTLPANGVLENVFLTTALPQECDDKAVVYIRLATTENSTSLGATLHNNASKGNLYVNNVIVAGEDNGSYKMPYTNKSTNYFGANGVIKYVSPDGLEMKYIVRDSDNRIVLSGTYPQTGIQLSTVRGFDNTKQEPYTVTIHVEEDEDTSIDNIATYYYKGETVVKFNYNDSRTLFTDYVSGDLMSVANTDGANSGTLEMYPNGVDATTLTYTNTYGVRASYSTFNSFAASKVLDNPADNGYWLISTSSKGFTNLTLNAEQLSSNKGPRDWGIAYSTDGKNFSYVDNSNARAISNDAATKPVETYGNLALPSACDNQDKLYIMVFINGGESVDGTELELITKGNTGINGIELSGIPITTEAELTTVLLADRNDTATDISIAGAEVYIGNNLVAVTNENGKAVIPVRADGQPVAVTIKGAGIAPRRAAVSLTDNKVPLMAYDVNNDGYVNAKDYAIIIKNPSFSGYKNGYKNFINVKTNEYVY